MTLGFLVRSTDNNLGIGKLSSLNDLEGTVEYFCSVGERLTQTVPRSSICRVKLQRQTRCYINIEAANAWIVGRIYQWDSDNLKYIVDLPDRATALVPEAEVFVRCTLPIDDPTDILAIKGQETPYFYDRRAAFVKSLVKQRAVSRGMTGLLSANIQLYPHQVEVVRRVLEDSTQRYLLADEVGLGKTVEAGAILRQFLLDEPEGKALILVPQHLVAQWHRELEDKFYISHFSNRFKLLAIEEWEKFQQNDGFSFLIIDEAHRVAAMAGSMRSDRVGRFQAIARLAHRCDSLLLLSATPVLNHERDFLAMLHLLDPVTYQLDDVVGFRHRVEKRQEIGRILLAFKEGANPFVLKTKLKQLQELFATDPYLIKSCDRLQACLENKEAPTAERDKLVRAIITHVSDTYRLHRRMLRNRRAVVEDAIFQRSAIPKAEYDLDERSYPIHELLDEWRTVAPKEEYQRIFSVLCQASGTWLEVLGEVIETRLQGVPSGGIRSDFESEDWRSLAQTPKFPGEEDILQSLLKIVRTPSEDGDRLELLKLIILDRLAEALDLQSYRSKPQRLQEEVSQHLRGTFGCKKLPKMAIFTSFTRSCAGIYDSLADIFGHQSIARHCGLDSREVIEQNVQRFETDPQCFLLVCDRTGEEGRNLQFIDAAIHFDLPRSPNQLEQRLGRFDRIGGKMAMKSWILAGADLPDSIHNAWYQLLKDGFDIFQNSIASLQFYVDEKLPHLEKLLFASGSSGILEAISAIQAEIAREQVKISEQNALDEIDALEENAARYFDELDRYDSKHQDIEKAAERWLCGALRFRRKDDPNLKDVRSYMPEEGTMVPSSDLQARFAPYARQKGVYDRRLANRYSGVSLHRIGEGFTDALASYLSWDDRGRAFAMWRHEEGWDAREGAEWVGFRFDYLVETDLERVEEVVKENGSQGFNCKALSRRADALFPPLIESMFLDLNWELVESRKLIEILQRPYRGKGAEFRDYNLAKGRASASDLFIESSQWEKVCRQARDVSERLLRDRPSFTELCQRRSDRATKKLERRLDRLQLRLNQLYDRQLERELELETAIGESLVAGIKSPRLKLDSVGFIIISGRNPFALPQEEVYR